MDEALQGIFRRVMGNDELIVTDETTAYDVEGWDSLSHVTLMFSIEQEFGIQFVGQEFAELGTVGELRRLIAKKTSHQV